MASFTASISRRSLLRTGIAGSALGVASLAAPVLSMVDARAQVSGPESTQVAEIYELQAAFHRAKTTQDIDLMMSLWAPLGSGSFIVNDTFLAGTLRNTGGTWRFQEMTAGPSSPLSFDHFYFP